MTEIFEGIIPPPSAWTGAGLGGKKALTRPAPAEALDAMDDLAMRLRGRDIPSITRSDVDHPAVLALMAGVRDDAMDGHGLSLVRGPDPARYDPDDYARLYWALGTLVGEGVVQSAFNDWVARVEVNPDLPWRGTTTDMELRAHTDFHEVMSLASISKPVSGGVSGFVSSLAVHNEIFRTRPDLLPSLYEGWYNTSPLRKPEAAPAKTPIYSCVEGKVSCFYNRVFFVKPEDAPEPFPAALTEAMALMDSIAARPDIRADFTLEPGEIAFWHNFQVMHSRTAFQDSEAHRRLLLRLWLNVPDGRPMAPEIKRRARVIDRDHLEGARPVPA